MCVLRVSTNHSEIHWITIPPLCLRHPKMFTSVGLKIFISTGQYWENMVLVFILENCRSEGDWAGGRKQEAYFSMFHVLPLPRKIFHTPLFNLFIEFLLKLRAIIFLITVLLTSHLTRNSDYHLSYG